MYLNFRPHEYCLVIVYAGDMWDGCEVSWVFYQLFLPELKRAILIVNNYCANQGITLISLPSHVNNTSKIRWAKLISLALNSAKTCSIKATIRFNYRGGKDEIYWEKPVGSILPLRTPFPAMTLMSFPATITCEFFLPLIQNVPYYNRHNTHIIKSSNM